MPTDTACQLIGFSVFPLGPRGQCLEVFGGRAICSREILLLPGAIRLSGRSGTATTVETFTQHPAFSGPQLCLVPEFTPALTPLLQASVQVGEGVYCQIASCSNFTPVLTSAPSWGSRARMVFFPSGFTPTVGCSFLWLAKAVSTPPCIPGLSNFVDLPRLLVLPLPFFHYYAFLSLLLLYVSRV